MRSPDRRMAYVAILRDEVGARWVRGNEQGVLGASWEKPYHRACRQLSSTRARGVLKKSIYILKPPTLFSGVDLFA